MFYLEVVEAMPFLFGRINYGAHNTAVLTLCQIFYCFVILFEQVLQSHANVD